MRLLFLIGVITWYVAAADDDFLQTNPRRFDTVVYNHNLFSNSILKGIVKYNYQNHVVSPIAAVLAISQAGLGARGKTRIGIDSVLPLSSSTSEDHGQIQDLVKSFARYFLINKDVQLYVANQMFMADHLKPIPEFFDTMWSFFATQPYSINMANNYAASVEINTWSSFYTKGQITNAITPEKLRRDADLVLMSTAYFRGYWQNPFDARLTEPMVFWSTPTSNERVPTMTNTGFYRTGRLEDIDAKFILLPYKNQLTNDGLSMIVIVPRKPSGIDAVINNFTNIDINYLGGAEYRYAKVKLPKFKVESSTDFSKPFADLGMNEAFGKYPNFRGIVNQPINVVQAIQRVAIEVDEGDYEFETKRNWNHMNTEETSYYHPEEVKVDNPFVVMIINNRGLVLFNGLISVPWAEKKAITK